MDKYKETFKSWNNLATKYQDIFMDLDLYNDSYDFICNSLKKDNPKILEIGCGPGNITKYLLNKRPDFSIFGIDVSDNMIKLAEKNNPQASFEVMDCRDIYQIKEKYDSIICGFCLPYLSQTDTKKLIEDCYRLLNENGIIYLSFVEGEPSKADFQVLSNGDKIYFYFHDISKLKEQLIENKFEEISIFKIKYKKSENISEIHTILIANKK